MWRLVRDLRDEFGAIGAAERDEEAIWEIVDREFVGEEFRCPTCDLALTGSAEIEAHRFYLGTGEFIVRIIGGFPCLGGYIPRKIQKA